MKKYSILSVWMFVILFMFSFFLSSSEALAITINAQKSLNILSESGNDGNAVWNNPGNAKTTSATSDAFATAVVDLSNPITHYIKATGFGFTIPTDATINGIKVRIERKKSSTAVIIDKTVSLVKENAIIGANRARTVAWEDNNVEDLRSYGLGTTDLWDTTWTVAEINSSAFGFAMSAKSLSTETVLLSVDYMTMTVYYSLPSNPVISEITAVPENTNDTTPEYTFMTNTSGGLTFSGNCKSTTIAVNPGNNTLVFDFLEDGLYSHCSILLTDSFAKKSNTLGIPPFRIDTIAPTITLNGNNEMELFVGETYNELGATAKDIFIVDQKPVSNDISVNITGEVATNSSGTYTLTYNATDLAGNVATSVTRKIIIKAKNNDSGSAGGGGGSVPIYILEQMNSKPIALIPESVKDEGEILGTQRFIFTLFLKLNSHNVSSKVNEIKELQKRLTREGFYSDPIDGKFKEKTEEAVKIYQRANSPLVVDGIVGKFTREVLNKEGTNI